MAASKFAMPPPLKTNGLRAIAAARGRFLQLGASKWKGGGCSTAPSPDLFLWPVIPFNSGYLRLCPAVISVATAAGLAGALAWLRKPATLLRVSRVGGAPEPASPPFATLARPAPVPVYPLAGKLSGCAPGVGLPGLVRSSCEQVKVYAPGVGRASITSLSFCGRLLFLVPPLSVLETLSKP